MAVPEAALEAVPEIRSAASRVHIAHKSEPLLTL